MSKNNVQTGTFFTAQAMSGNFTATAVDLNHDWNLIHITVSWAGNTGSTSMIDVQVSDDNTNWDAYTADSDTLCLTTETDQQYIIPVVTFRYIRLKFTKNSETTGLISSTYTLINTRD